MCHGSECGCGHPASHFWGHGWHHPWGGHCGPGCGPRHFPTEEEAIAELEGYRRDLQAEAERVEKQLAQLRKGKE